ncbi:MAG: helix-turn-helix domain-containing protein [Alphaproteobacteria bacterium]|jgi:hypothetical protein
MSLLPCVASLAAARSRDPLVDGSIGLAVELVAYVEAQCPAVIFGPTRQSRSAADARHLAIYLAHMTLGHDVSVIGRIFRRDRATIRHAVRRIAKRREDSAFDAKLVALESILAPLSHATAGAKHHAR